MNWGVKDRFRRTITVLLLSLSSAMAVSTLHHIPPGTQLSGNAVELEAIVVTDVDVIEGTVFFRVVGQSSYHESPMTFDGGLWKGTVSPRFVTAEGLEYVLVFRLSNGSSLAYPPDDPFDSPHRLTVQAARETGGRARLRRGPGRSQSAADVLIIGPPEGQVIPAADVLVMVSLFNVQNVDLNSIALFLDDQNVTTGATVSPEIVSYVPGTLSPGRHTVSIELANTFGSRFQPVTWSFTVAERSEEIITAADEFSYKGKVRTDISLDQVDDQPRSIGETAVKLEGGWQWLGLRTDLRIASDESELRQPRNRYGLVVNSGDKIALSLGDFTPVLSPYTIDGKRVRGVGIDVNLDWFRFQVINGELERAIQGSPETDEAYRVTEVTADSLNGSIVPLYVLDRTGYTFQRNVKIYRLGFSFRNRFQFALNFQKAKDEISTVDRILPTARFSVSEDTLLEVAQIDTGIYSFEQFQEAVEGTATYELAEKQWGGNTPQDNVVLGFDLGLSFDDRRLTFGLDWAMSLLNRNIWDGSVTLNALDTLLDDSTDDYVARTYDDEGNVQSDGFSLGEVANPADFHDFFVINEFMTPLVPIDLEGYGKTPLAAILNMPSEAYRVRMRAYYYGNTLKLEYAQVGPEFKSLSNPYLSSNLREFVLSDRVRLIENKMAVNFEFKHRDNSILREVADEYSQNTVSGGFLLTPGFDLPTFSSNFQSVTRSNAKTALDTVVYTTLSGEDSVSLEDRRENTKTQNKLFSVNLPFRSGDVRYNVQGTFSSAEVVDLLEEERDESFSSPNSISSSYSVTASAKYPFPLRLALNLSGYTYELPVTAVGSGSERESRLTNVGLDGTYTAWGGLLKLQGGLSYSWASGISEFRYYGIKGSAEWEPLTSLVIRATSSVKAKQVEGEVNLATLAVKFSVNYVF